MAGAGAAWDEAQAKAVLAGLGIAVPGHRVCETGEQARAALDELGGPVAIKLLDAAVLHKTEIGGVRLSVRTHAQVDDAVAGLKAVGARRLLVEAMAGDGVDLIAGARRDPVFGPVVLLGLGGTVAEVLKDVSIRLAPLTAADAGAMVSELAGALAAGRRGLAEHVVGHGHGCGEPHLQHAQRRQLVGGRAGLLVDPPLGHGGHDGGVRDALRGDRGKSARGRRAGQHHDPAAHQKRPENPRTGEREVVGRRQRHEVHRLLVEPAHRQHSMEAAGVARYKWPERLEVLEQLPVTNVGKIDKKALRSHVARRLTDPSPGGAELAAL